MIIEQSKQIISEINRAFIGKNEVIEKVLMTIYAGGHVLLEDCPGVGKTTLAVAFSRVLGLSTRRIQFTPDTLPSDITGFTMWNRKTGEFEYREGAANCQLLLADEINRTSPKTQSALLEVMEERTITVGRTRSRRRSSVSRRRIPSASPARRRSRRASSTASWSRSRSAIPRSRIR